MNPTTRAYLQALALQQLTGDITSPRTMFSPPQVYPRIDPQSPEGKLLIRRWQLESYFPTDDISHQLITVALPNDYDLTVLKNKLENGLQYQYLDTAIARVERHSDGGKPNLHLHILKKGNYQKSKIIRDLSRHFKIDKNFVDVRSSKSRTKYNNALNYVHGAKKDDAKLADVELDIQWRLDNGFAEIYNLTV